MGRSLIAELLARGHAVRAVVRETSRGKLPAGCNAIIGDALDERSYAEHVAGCDVFVHLVVAQMINVDIGCRGFRLDPAQTLERGSQGLGVIGNAGA